MKGVLWVNLFYNIDKSGKKDCLFKVFFCKIKIQIG